MAPGFMTQAPGPLVALFTEAGSSGGRVAGITGLQCLCDIPGAMSGRQLDIHIWSSGLRSGQEIGTWEQ